MTTGKALSFKLCVQEYLYNSLFTVRRGVIMQSTEITVGDIGSRPERYLPITTTDFYVFFCNVCGIICCLLTRVRYLQMWHRNITHFVLGYIFVSLRGV